MESASLIFWRKASTAVGKVPSPSKSVLSIGKGSMSMYSISKPLMDLLSSIAITKHTQNQNPTPKKKKKEEKKKKLGKGKYQNEQGHGYTSLCEETHIEPPL